MSLECVQIESIFLQFNPALWTNLVFPKIQLTVITESIKLKLWMVNNNTIVWSPDCPISNLSGRENQYWTQLTLCQISAKAPLPNKSDIGQQPTK